MPKPPFPEEMPLSRAGRPHRVAPTNGGAAGMTLPRYERPRETHATVGNGDPGELIPFARLDEALAGSPLSAGSRALLRGLMRTGTTRVFPGGGIGIEYGSLLKTAVRPDELGGHVREAAAHLREQQVDLLLVPGMSGYPVGAMYALAAGIPALLLKKQKLAPDGQDDGYPAGSFVIPSYTGEGDVVMSADLEAARDMVAGIAARQLAAQADSATITLTIRCAGADDIIDKATMAHAVCECAPRVCAAALDEALARHRAATGDARPAGCRVEAVAWVTPLIKSYNGPREQLRRRFGIDPFAGLSITSVHLDPPALGIEGVGTVGFVR